MAFIIEVFFSGCISKVINDGKDYSWSKIKSVIKDRHDQNISTKIYRLIESVLNIVTDNTYKNSDDLYDAIEKIFIEFKNHGDTLESVKSGLDVLGADASNQRCENFLEKFHEGVCRDDDLYKVVIWDLEQMGININQEEFQKLNEKINRNHVELVEKIDNINENLNGSSLVNEENTNYKDLVFENNKKQDYIKIWNSRLFLHLDNNEKPLTLADVFIKPDYTIYQYSQKINFSDKDTLEDMIEKFVSYERTSTMLVTGVPGMGKTSIVSWIAQKYEANDDLIILRFRDWDSEDLDNGLLKAICNTLKCNRKNLNGKLLVLDGFDEIKSLDRRKQILNKFLNDIKDLEKSKIIITSRPTYIDSTNFQIRVELLQFGVEKIQRFYQKITRIKLNENEINKSNLDVIGIPVILYMAIMSGIDITKNATKPELYNHIFAERGGIFDKFCEYDSGSQIMRNPDNIMCYLEFLRITAFKMFEKNELVLSRSECEIPELSFQGKTVSVLEFPIKHLFENTSANIEFIHTSIYEYFVSEYIFCAISEIIKEDNFKIEDLSCIMGKLFKYRKLTSEIIEFLEYKVRNSLNNKYDIVSNAFDLMLENGMTYYTGECYRNVMDCEMNIFSNMLEIIHFWDKDYFTFNNKITDYIVYNKSKGLNLRKLDLERLYLYNVNLNEVNLNGANLNRAHLNGIHLSGAYLNGIHLNGASLIRADLSKAFLCEAYLDGADLRGAYLNGVHLRGAYLRGTYLKGVDLRGVDLNGVDLSEAILKGSIINEDQIDYLIQNCNLQEIRVYIEEMEDSISYDEYCEKRIINKGE